MSVLFSNSDISVISHLHFVSNIYNTTHCKENVCKFELRNELFEITHPYKETPSIPELNDDETPRKKKKVDKRKKKLDPTAAEVKQLFEEFLQSVKRDNLRLFDEPQPAHGSNRGARQTAEMCSTSSMVLSNLFGINGGNTAQTAVFQHLTDCDILLPANCRFFCGDVRTTLPKLTRQLFDLVILDPPWWNKYIRRSKAKNPDSSYSMLYNEEIANIPLEEFLSRGAVVGVWCTNCAAHETAIKEVMFPAWGVSYAATWFWMKITKSGIPICPFTEHNGKQPFEKIILGIYKRLPNQSLPTESRIVISVPSALHSHKPPLNDVLAPFLVSENSECLEIFARYLLPNTTSLGLEPLRWQHSLLYNKTQLDQ